MERFGDSSACQSTSLPDSFRDLQGQEWIILPFRIAHHALPNTFCRTIVDAQMAGQDYPASRMIKEAELIAILEDIEKVRANQPRQAELLEVNPLG